MIIKKLKNIERYNNRISYPVNGKAVYIFDEKDENGKWIKWEDLNKLIMEFEK